MGKRKDSYDLENAATLKQFSARLGSLIRMANVRQEDVAIAINRSKALIYSYIAGIISPSFCSLIKIADYFGVSVDFLLGHQNSDTGSADLVWESDYAKQQSLKAINLILITEFETEE